MQMVDIGAVASTNLYCELLDLSEVEELTVFYTHNQFAGIGQRGNTWHSTPNKNLTFSVILKPTFLPANHQFRLTMALSLAVVDCLDTLSLAMPIAIKWPNDIYIGNKKICGTLISNHLHGQYLATSICGIGLNVNEANFPSSLPLATSLLLETTHETPLMPLLEQLVACIKKRYDALRHNADPTSQYLQRMYGRGQQRLFEANDIKFSATVQGVDPLGHLLLITDDGEEKRYNLKEIKWL